MNRFDKKSERFWVLKGLLPVAVFCVVIGIFRPASALSPEQPPNRRLTVSAGR